MDMKQKGFTLIEILVVVTIIGVLAGLVVVLIPRGQEKANIAECTNNQKQLAQTLISLDSTKFPEKYTGVHVERPTTANRYKRQAQQPSGMGVGKEPPTFVGHGGEELDGPSLAPTNVSGHAGTLP